MRKNTPSPEGLEGEDVIANKKAEKNGAAPKAKVRDHDHHVLVCGGGDCKKRGAKDVRKALKKELRSAGRGGDVRVDGVDCLGLCKHGPNVVVYPPGAWYLGLTEDRVPEVVDRHLAHDEPVERFAAEFRPRKSKKK